MGAVSNAPGTVLSKEQVFSEYKFVCAVGFRAKLDTCRRPADIKALSSLTGSSFCCSSNKYSCPRCTSG